MIAQLRGILLSKSSTEIIVDCGGVGYSAYVSINTVSTIRNLEAVGLQGDYHPFCKKVLG